MKKTAFILGKLALDRMVKVFYIESMNTKTIRLKIIGLKSVVTTSNNSFGPTEISYLEHRIVNIAKESNRYEVKNGNIPNIGNVTEEKQFELEDFLDNAKIVMVL